MALDREIRNSSNSYSVGRKVAETDSYRLYLCIQNETGRQCLFQIAVSVEHNGGLERAAYILKKLQSRADDLEAEYARVKTDPNVFLNYGLGFPDLADSFISQEQGARRVNILAFRNVEEIGKMVPLDNIIEKDGMRVDLRTSAWIMGKLLKMLAFAHGEKISVGLLNGRNVIIEPNEHYVLIFDWSAARTHTEYVPLRSQLYDISQAAKAVVAVLGGDLETGVFPDDDNSGYADYILGLARGKGNNAQKAHGEFYDLVDKLWKREYHPFTTKLNK